LIDQRGLIDRRCLIDRGGLVNRRVLIVSAVLVVLGVPGIYFWHRFQVRDHAADFLTQATALEEQGDYRRAAELLRRYTSLRPGDGPARVRLARTFDRVIQTPQDVSRAAEMYTRALGAVPDEPALRERLIELLMQLDQFGPARQHAETLLEKDPQNSVALRARALALLGMFRQGSKNLLLETLAALELARGRLPEDIALATGLAALYRFDTRASNDADRKARAVGVMDNLIEVAGDKPEAYLARYKFRMSERVGGASEDLQRAFELGPKNLDVLLAMGGRAGAEGKLADAKKYFEQATEVQPRDPRGYLGWGEVLTRLGDPDEALRVWDRGLVRTGGKDIPLALCLSEALLNLRRYQEADAKITVLAGEVNAIPRNVPRDLRTRLLGHVDYLQGASAFHQGRVHEALAAFRRCVIAQQIAPESQEEIRRQLRTQEYLGNCYAALRQWDLSASAYEQASRLDPSNPDYLIAAAQSWEQTGRRERAATLYQQALELVGAPPSAAVKLAQTVFAIERNKPTAQRDWSGVERALATARRIAPSEAGVVILAADVALAQGDEAGAIEILEQGAKEHPDLEALERAKIFALEQMGDAERADAALAAFANDPSRAEAAERVRQALATRREGADALVTDLQNRLEQATPEEQGAIRSQLVGQYLRLGRVDDARRVLEELAEQFPQELQFPERLAEMALNERDFDQAARWEEVLHRLEGADGSVWRYVRARRMAALASGPEDPTFAEAVKLQEQIQAMRSAWPQSVVLKGELAARQGKFADAIEAFKSALHLGDRSVATYERLVVLLHRQNQMTEAERYLRQLQDHLASSRELSPLAITVFQQLGELQQALSVAEAAVRERPDDAMAHVWLGQMLGLAERHEEAEKSFYRATELARDDARTWVSLLGYLARTNQEDKAQQVLEQLESEAALPAATLAFVLAQGYELVGDADTAEWHYRYALRFDPNNHAIQERAAEFFAGRDTKLAEASLRRLYELEPESPGLRRSLAALLANRDNEQAFEEAMGLVAAGLAAAEPDPRDLRLQAKLLMRRGRLEDLRQAQEVLERITQDGSKALPEDRLQLARLYEMDGRLQRAREQLLTLISGKDPQPTHVAIYVDLLLRRQSASDATRWLELLETREPLSPRTLSLRGRWLHQQGKNEEIEPLVARYLERLNTEAYGSIPTDQLAFELATLFAAVELPEPAERWYRELMRTSPRDFTHYADWLASQGRTEDAVRLCVERAEVDVSAMPAVALCRVLSRAEMDPKQFAGASELIAQACTKYPRQAELWYQLGQLRSMLGEPEEAIGLWERVLECDPRHVGAMSRLAWELSGKPERLADAVSQIRQATVLAGSDLDVQDTYALIMLRAGQSEEAILRLRQVASSPAATARHQLHLAWALQRSGSTEQARVALKAARQQRLDERRLPPEERAWLRELEAALAS
jgi:tetratricopeptide (TPR) repeat protein